MESCVEKLLDAGRDGFSSPPLAVFTTQAFFTSDVRAGLH